MTTKQKFQDKKYAGDRAYNLNEHGKPKFYECGICDQMHPAAWNDDCRDDANRFTIMDIEEKYGKQRADVPDDSTDYGWELSPMPGDEADDDDDDDETAGDDLCDLCMSSGVHSGRTTYCGKTIGIECGCDGENESGICGDEKCEQCQQGDE